MSNNWNDIHTSSRKYLSADTFEEWLMEKHEITEENYEGLSYDRKDLLKNEYRDDMDFASFVSGEWFEESRVYEEDNDYDSCDEDSGYDDGVDDEDEDSGYDDDDDIDDEYTQENSEKKRPWIILCCALLFLPLIFAAVSAFRIRYAPSPDETARENAIIDTFYYENLTPGKKYTLTIRVIDKETGTALMDEDGNPVVVRKTFVPETSNGSIDTVIPLPETEHDVVNDP